MLRTEPRWRRLHKHDKTSEDAWMAVIPTQYQSASLQIWDICWDWAIALFVSNAQLSSDNESHVNFYKYEIITIYFVLSNKRFVKKRKKLNGKREAGKISKHCCNKAWQNGHKTIQQHKMQVGGKYLQTRQNKTWVCFGFREQFPASDSLCLIIDGPNYLFIHLPSFLCLPTLPFESENKGNLAGRNMRAGLASFKMGEGKTRGNVPFIFHQRWC